MDVVQNENAFAESRNKFVEDCAWDSACGRFESIKQSVFILLGLKFTDEPRASIREGFVINVYWILRSKQETETKGTRLFQHAQEWLLGSGIALRRQITEDFVHVEDGA